MEGSAKSSERYFDYAGRSIRLTRERLVHINEHPEMRSLSNEIPKVLRFPEVVVESVSDNLVNLYYRNERSQTLGSKHLCVVVKLTDDPFVITAYVTDRVKQGRVVWPDAP